MNHGTRWSYARHGCRCHACTEAHRVSCLAYRRRRGDRPIRVYQDDRRKQAAARKAIRGDGRPMLHAELERARASVTGELAVVVRAQEHDDRFGCRVWSWLISLDARDVYGRERYETVVPA